MNFNTPLTSSQLTLARSGSYSGDYYVSLCKNRVVMAAQTNIDLTQATSWADIAFYNVTVGSYTNIEVGHAVIVAPVNDITKGTYRGRVRRFGDSYTLKLAESSQKIPVNSYLWVIDTFDVAPKLSRADINNNQIVDFDIAYTPPAPNILGLQTAYAGFTNPSTGYMRIAFDVSASYAKAAGASLTTYQWSFSNYVVVSGSLSGATVTVDLSAGEQWGKCTVVDSSGGTKTRHFYITVHDATHPPDAGFENITITGDIQRGWTMSAAAFTGVANLLPDTFCVVWRDNERYGGTAGNIAPNNVAFVGWLQHESNSVQGDPTYSVLSQTSFDFTGVGARMARAAAQLLPFYNKPSPSVWGDVLNLTVWRAIGQFLDWYTTVGGLCDIDFSDRSDTFLFPTIVTQGASLLDAANGIAQEINALLEFAPDGRISVNRDAVFLDAGGRASLPTIMAFGAEDAFNLSMSRDVNNSIGKVDGDGAFYNPNNGRTTAYTVRAPGHAQGSASGTSQLASQILAVTTDATAALNELRQRAGNKFALDNLDETLDVDHPDGYTFLIPSRAQYYTFTLDTTLAGAGGVSRIVYANSIRWTLEGVTYTRTGNGATGIKAHYRKLPDIGGLADNTTQVPVNTPNPVPDLGLPAFNFELPELTFPDLGLDLNAINPAQLNPPAGYLAAVNGQFVVIKSGNRAFALKNFITLKSPQASEVTPPDLGAYAIKQILIDPFATKSAVGCYILASDGTNSAVWYTSNVATPTPQWAKGADTVGVYTVIRAGSTAGAILLYSPGAPVRGWCYKFDFTVSDGGWQAVIGGGDGIPRAAYGDGAWHSILIAGVSEIRIWRAVTLSGITRVEAVYANGLPLTGTHEVFVGDFDGTSTTNLLDTAPTAPVTIWDFTSSPQSFSAGIRVDAAYGDAVTTHTLTSLVFKGAGTNPFDADNC